MLFAKMNLLRRTKLTMLGFVVLTSVNAQTGNRAPFVIPSLRQWQGATGSFEWKKNTRLVVDVKYKKPLLLVAGLLAEDYVDFSSRTHLKVSVGRPSDGDVYFTLDKKDTALHMEGYRLSSSNHIAIEAHDSIGAIWATSTLLQLLEQAPQHRFLSKGTAVEYPQYAVRGFVLDDGRKFFSLQFLKDYIRFMSYYKMNDFHIHLNDNGFDLQKMAQRYDVNIIPEIDVPAHSLAFSKAVPDIGSKQYGMEHLDLDNPLIYTLIDNVFKEYLQGPNPVFIGKEVHIGTDEYNKKESEKFRAFIEHYIRLVEGYGKEVRMWGALTHAQGKTPVKADGVTMNLWCNGYADPKEMFALGYKGISTPDGWLYIVPAAGYYYDYLHLKKLYEEWTPNKIGEETFDENDSNIRGGSFAVWNDHVGNGITEKDVHDRVFPAMQVLSQKMWDGSATPMNYASFAALSKNIGEGPGLNMRGRIISKDSLVFSLDLKSKSSAKKPGNIKNAVINNKEQALQLNGDCSFLETNLIGIGYDYTVSFFVKPVEENAANAILFGSKDAVVTLNQQGSGKLGFSREGYHYAFDYKVPVNQWTHIVIEGHNKGTSLYVNGRLKEKLEGAMKNFSNGKSMTIVQTLFFPHTIYRRQHQCRQCFYPGFKSVQ